MSIREHETRRSFASGRVALACVIAMLLGSAALVSAKDDSKGGKGKDKGKPADAGGSHGRQDASKHDGRADDDDGDDDDDRDASSGRGFTSSDERILRRWFADAENRAALPPGLAKRETLPPGLQRQIRKNGKLPYGLQKRIEPLPDDCERRLPRLPIEIRRVIVGRDVLLVNDTTQVVLDILHDVLRR